MSRLHCVVDHSLDLVTVFFRNADQADRVTARRLDNDVCKYQSFFDSDLRYLPKMDRLSSRFANRMILVFLNTIWPYSNYVWRKDPTSLESRSLKCIQGLGHSVAKNSFPQAFFIGRVL